MKHESHTGLVLKKLNQRPKTPQEKQQMQQSVQAALNEIAYGISGSALTAYHSACAVDGGDWVDMGEAGTLQEMQTVVLLADLLQLVLNHNQTLDYPDNQQEN